MNVKNTYVSTTFAKDNSLLFDIINQCKNAGILSIEIGSNHCFENDYNYLKDFSFDYLVHNYFPIPKDSFVLNIASFNDDIRKLSLDHIKKAINLCNEINAKLYTFHPGFLTDPEGSNLSDKNYDFQWDNNQLKNININKATELMYKSLDEIIELANDKNVSIAIETEGSVSKKDHLLMQKPDEYKIFMNRYNPNEIGINLNIGHLNLASNSFQFDRVGFVSLVKDYIVAMELSHNDGIEDQHLPLQAGSWYWDIICDASFKDVYKILEFRNTSIKKIINNLKMFKRMIDAI